MNNPSEFLNEVKILIRREIKIVEEIVSIQDGLKTPEGKEISKMAESQIINLKKQLEKTVDELTGILEDMTITKPLPKNNIVIDSGIELKKEEKEGKLKTTLDDEKEEKEKTKKHKIVDVDLTRLERNTLKRIKNKRIEKDVFAEQKASKYVRFCNSVFGNFAQKLSKTTFFMDLQKDMLKANLKYVISSYIALIFMTCLISFFVGIFVAIFFLFFNLGTQLPIITFVDEAFLTRLLKIFWIPLAAPVFTFLGMYVYPAVEKAYLESKIDQELPFATIHMSAIAGSMVEPSKIFDILLSTKEYVALEKEFKKIINLINVYGYDFVTALRNVAKNSPSQKLTDLLNGLATTINSGGRLEDFFEKRAQTLLFDYKIERDKYTKSAETFMDIYISLVIAAPMILMLLLMMMRVSGLGISLSTSMITLLMILGVAMVNIVFLVFLQLKQPTS